MTSKQNNRLFVGIGVLVWKDSQLLLGKRIVHNAENVWQFPGGRLEFGETVSECARREVIEEVGIEIDHIEHLGYTNEVSSVSGRQYITLFVSAIIAGGNVTVMEPEKCECWQWFSASSLPKPLFRPISNYLKQHPDLSVFCHDQDTQEGAHI